MTTFALKDSGERQSFATGAVRDTQDGKGRYDLLPCHAIHRVAQVFQKGAQKYEDRNWEQGMPLSRFLDSALRHTFTALAGQEDEDHLAQAAWNILCAIETRQWARSGVLPASLDDVAERQPGKAVGASVAGPVLGSNVERIYVAGPYTGETEEDIRKNVSRALVAAEQIMQLGHDAHCPHTATHEIAEYSRVRGRALDYERWMRLDLSIIEKWATAVFYLHPSPGANREVIRARELGLKIYTKLEQIPDLRKRPLPKDPLG